ncbi:unnamed protein product [Dicrocoelium dendriticum]|nr:unnamed protein product [Dicrocoelium dendriticum]
MPNKADLPSAERVTGIESPEPPIPTTSLTQAIPGAAGAVLNDVPGLLVSHRSSRIGKPSEKAFDDMQIMRRIIAEDETFNLSTVPPLTDLCLKHCIQNFEYKANILPHLNSRQRRKLLDELGTDTPLKVTAHQIGEDLYWKRCCHSRWPVIDLARHGGVWKRAFFEHMLEETIERFVPGHTYLPRLTECVAYAAPYVHRLDIRQLLPPLKQQSTDGYSENNSDEESNSEFGSDLQTADHLDLGPMLVKLPNLEELSVSYTVKDCGMNFEWSIFQFTVHDCVNLAKAIQQHKNIRALHLTKSRVDSDRCRVLVNHILQHPTLECLDLSHNFIGDRGARALGKLISGNNQLRTLNLADNRLQATGALALAHALAKKSCTLVRLNLRLNRLRDDGGIAIAKSLLRNTSLKELNLAANDLGETASNYLAHVIAHNRTLTHLDLSNNQVGVGRNDGQPEITDDISLPEGVTSVANQHNLGIPSAQSTTV